MKNGWKSIDAEDNQKSHIVLGTLRCLVGDADCVDKGVIMR